MARMLRNKALDPSGLLYSSDALASSLLQLACLGQGPQYELLLQCNDSIGEGPLQRQMQKQTNEWTSDCMNERMHRPMNGCTIE